MPSFSKLRERLGIRPASRLTSPPQPSAISTQDPAQFNSASLGNNNAFTEALRRHLDELPAEEVQSFQNAYQTVEPLRLFQKISTIDQENRQSGGRKFLDPVEKLFNILNQLMRPVAIGIQASPEISALVVGGARLVIDLALNFATFFKKLTTMINCLTDHLGHLQEFSTHPDPLILNSTANIYGGLLKFYHHAYHVFKDKANQDHRLGHLGTFLRVQWEPFEVKFGEIDKDIQHHIDVLRLSSQAKILSTVTKIDSEFQKESNSTAQTLRIEDRRKLLAWVSPLHADSKNQERILRKRWPGTGSWLLEHDDFRSWFSSLSSSVLWCHGPPGVGKSVLSSIIVDHIQHYQATALKKVGLAYVYFRYDQFDNHQPEQIIAYLLKQLVQSLETFPKPLTDFFDTHYRNDKRPTLESYFQVFYSVANQFAEIFLVVDALDECNEDARNAFLPFLYDLSERVLATKVIVTSRPESSISDFLSSFGAGSIDIRAKNTKKDIARYVKGRLDNLTRPTQKGGRPQTQTLRIQDQHTKDVIYDVLVKLADGVFLWVDLQLNDICREKNDEDILDALSSLPADLNDTYSRILEQIKAQSRPLRNLARKCLMWVFCAEKPLCLYELRDAVNTDRDCASSAEIQRNRRKYSMFDIMDSCRNILVSEDPYQRDNYSGWSIVRPIHYSLINYLNLNLDVLTEDAAFSILQNSELIHAELAEICMTYLSVVYLKDGPARDFYDLRERLGGNSDPFAWYCARYFDEHLIMSGDAARKIQTTIGRLLSMDQAALAALAQLRHMRLPNCRSDFLIFDWNVNARTIIKASKLCEIAIIDDDSRWKDMEVHPFTLHQACVNQSVEQVKRLLALGLDPSTEDYSKRTPFAIAVDRNDVDIVKLLLRSGVDVNKPIEGYNVTALERASWLDSLPMVKTLIEHGAKRRERNFTLSGALIHAIWGSASDVAKYLLSQGAVGTDQCLLEASTWGLVEVVEALLEQGIDPNGKECERKERWSQDSRPLYCAAKWGWTQIVQLLLQSGANANLIGGNLGTPLQAAALGSRLDIVNVLLQQKPALNEVVGDYGSALMASACSGSKAITRALLDAGADVNLGGDPFGSALVASMVNDPHRKQKGSKDGFRKEIMSTSRGNSRVTLSTTGDNVTEMLLDAGADIQSYGQDALRSAIERGYFSLVELLLKRGCSLDSLKSSGDTSPLCAAVSSENLSLVKLLVHHGADPNEQRDGNKTALIEAARRGNEGMVQLLIDAGADVNQKGKCAQGEVHPLHAACYGGNTSVLKNLIANGADTNATSEVSVTYLFTRGSWTQKSAPRSILQAACALDLSEHVIKKFTKEQKLEIVHFLLEHGAEVNRVDEQGCTALEVACIADPKDLSVTEVVRILLDNGADANAQGALYVGAIEAASARDNADVVKLLLSSGLDDTVQRESALQVAASFGYDRIIRLLIDAGVSAHARQSKSRFCKEGDSPIHSASLTGSSLGVDLLLAASADADSKGFFGTPFEAALVGHARSYDGQGGWGKVIHSLRAKGVVEPREDCHFGIQCDGPLCVEDTTKWVGDHISDGQPEDWLIGLRYKCRKCRVYNLCARCKIACDENGVCVKNNRIILKNALSPDNDDSQESDMPYSSDEDDNRYHRLQHEFLEYTTREFLGQEETLGNEMFDSYRNHPSNRLRRAFELQTQDVYFPRSRRRSESSDGTDEG